MRELLVSSSARPGMYRPGGLCNRIKSYVSAMRIGNETDRRVRVYWPEDESRWPYCGSPGFVGRNELMAHELADVNIVDRGDPRKCIVADTWRWLLLSSDIRERWASPTCMPAPDGRSIDFEFARVSKDIRREIVAELRHLRLPPAVRDDIDGFAKRYALDLRIGIHVRRGDFVTVLDPRRVVSKDAGFFERIEFALDLNPYVEFFLATDDAATQDRFESKYPGKFVSYPKNWKAVHESAVQDLYLLARCNGLIGSRHSTFTEVAWYLAGAEGRIAIA